MEIPASYADNRTMVNDELRVLRGKHFAKSVDGFLEMLPPNPEQKWQELLIQLAEDLDAHGVAYLWKVPQNARVHGSPVKELRRLDPECVKVGYRESDHLYVTERPIGVSAAEGMYGWIKLPLSEVKVFRKEQTRGNRIMSSLYPHEVRHAELSKRVALALLEHEPELFTDGELAKVGLTRWPQDITEKIVCLGRLVETIPNGLLVSAGFVRCGITDAELASVGLIRVPERDIKDRATYISQKYLPLMTDEELARIGLVRIERSARFTCPDCNATYFYGTEMKHQCCIDNYKVHWGKLCGGIVVEHTNPVVNTMPQGEYKLCQMKLNVKDVTVRSVRLIEVSFQKADKITLKHETTDGREHKETIKQEPKQETWRDRPSMLG